jgi:hypothetical protein
MHIAKVQILPGTTNRNMRDTTVTGAAAFKCKNTLLVLERTGTAAFKCKTTLFVLERTEMRAPLMIPGPVRLFAAIF